MGEVLLECRHLKKYFDVPNGVLHAVDDISFSLEKGKTLGVVGESGCGKSTLGRTILRLLPHTSGEVIFEGKDILQYSRGEMKELRKKMQIIFQDPFSSLNPRYTVFETIREPLKIHKMFKTQEETNRRVRELMEVVGLASRYENTYPHELDGGRRQRIGIARALALTPQFIVCDEPVSALDVSIQAQVLNLMMDLKDSMGLTYMFITHDLSVVKHISDEIIVMYLGQIVEKARGDDIFAHPMHPYTKALLSAIPIPDIRYKGKEAETIKGELSSPINPKPGCRFAPRCPRATEKCRMENPELKDMGDNHLVACHLY
ncbi:MAG TPA: ATP-binding cassette domain-containing protein [Candidatus Agathobaculum stercoravium]|nr:oligopeptide/dipeptide ABC transporter ATP-binding protein [uncultured Agathobaculum sp.]HIV97782.1 ATP-binding cassette domain-containing protein [Candidatus Agathobaculum stercoravium]